MAKLAERPTFTQKGGWWVVGQFLLILFILIIPGPRLVSTLFSPKVCHIVGGGSLLVAILFILLGAKNLGEGLTPFPYPAKRAPLVIVGIYRFIRHPLYLGVILGGIGISIFRMNIVSIGLSYCLGLFLNAKANREEEWLRQKFSEYEDYRKKTKKIIPFIF